MQLTIDTQADTFERAIAAVRAGYGHSIPAPRGRFGGNIGLPAGVVNRSRGRLALSLGQCAAWIAP
ncbi:hypothetical protein [Streptomyces chartreusis]|uniref:hypothetical protein n=1 Tax=Streptomyces chartreusis TaxID=1969 RepID=UPI00167A7387|nr:hypothetical protein [Streptomyces chartreusis]GGX57861.1 hypothetical protein GCM10010321_88510 [Streptomyces chartreusis]